MGDNRNPTSMSSERLLSTPRRKISSLRHDVFDFKDRLHQQVQRLKDQRNVLLEHLQDAEAERDRLSLGLSRHAWQLGLFYAPLSGLGKAAEEGARRIQQLRTEKKVLAQKLQVKLMEMEHQLERQRALWGEDAVICEPTSMKLMDKEVKDVQQLQKQLSSERLDNDERDALYEKSKERLKCLQVELQKIRADVQERLAVVEPAGGLEAAWQAEQAGFNARLEAVSAGSAAQAAAEGALDCALRRSVTCAGAVQAELRGRSGELRVLSSVAASLLPTEQSGIPTVKEYLGARHYYGLVVAAKAQREQMLSAIQNISSRLREADARSKQLREALLADRRLLAAMEAQLELSRQSDGARRRSSAAQAALVRVELLEAEVRARETAVALASQDALRQELGYTREVVRVRRLYEQALGVVLCRPAPDHCDFCSVCGSCGDPEACLAPTT